MFYSVEMGLESRFLDIFTIPTLIFILMFSSIITAANSDGCNQTCPDGGWTTHELIYPFGFSEGCKIRLNCTKSRHILIGDFRVKTITKDNIWVEVPANLSRPTETVMQLYTSNFAPSLQNLLILVNCTNYSSNCPKIESSPNNMTNRKNVGCLSDGFKRMNDLVSYVRRNRTDCQHFYSSIVVKQSPPVFYMIKLAWWLEGSCQCSQNANCMFLSLPYGKAGYQCRCNKGFRGDGYPESLPCQEGHFMKVLAMSVALAAVLLLILSLMSCIRKRIGKFGNNHMKDIKNDYSQSQEEDLELPLFDFVAIKSATNDFSDDNKIGEGGFGPVYKGIWEGGEEIAVKRLSKSSRQGLKEFKNEVILIAKLQHRNLVKLLGCCIEGDEKMLIYEYMSNKSLDAFIFDSTHNETLNWPKRMHIINGIVRGLVYLHQDSRLRIIHRDLKASNILLDNELNPKISDFGMAKSFEENDTERNTNKVVGTYGYMPPEYVIDGNFSIKSDVFSFGVLVLEIISGKRNRGFLHKDHSLNLLGHAWMLYLEGRCSELIDASIGDSFSLSEVVRLIHIGLLCVQQSPKDRPNMSDVVLMMGGEGTLPHPKQPGFYIKRDLLEPKCSSSSNKIYSFNEVTMSALQPR